MNKIFKLWGGYVAFVFLLAGCASAVHVEKDKKTDFSRYRTFAWVENNESRKDRKTNDLTEQKVKDAVNQELEKAGWKESSGRPDVLLNYDLLVERNIKENSNPVYSQPYSRMFYNRYTRRWTTIYYPSEFMGYENEQVPVREGTITITMIDARTDKTVWQGWTTDEVNSRNMSSKEIQSSVRSIFRKFDVAKN